MRRVLIALALLTACHDDSPDGPCAQDSDCPSGDVCSRDESCWPSGDVGTVHITWTIDGGAAGSDACSAVPNFFLNFWSQDGEEEFGFAPVPCNEGEFSIDKLPDVYTLVELGDANGDFESGQIVDVSEPIVNGSAAFDLSL